MMMFAKNNYIDDKSNVAAARQYDASKKLRNSDYFFTFYSIPINPQTPTPNQEAALVTGNKPLFL